MSGGDIFSVTAIVFLLVAATVFSAAEQALQLVSPAKLVEAERRGSKRAERALELLGRRQALSSPLLLGRGLVLLAATVLAAELIFRMAAGSTALIGFTGLGFLVFMFGELVPKHYAASHPDRVIISLLPVLSPLGAMINPVGQAFLRLAGHKSVAAGTIPPSVGENGMTKDHAGTDEVLLRSDKAMMGGLLDLGKLENFDVMIHRTKIISVNAGEKISDILTQVLKSGHSRLPVWRDQPDNIIGIIHAKDLFAAMQQQGGDESKVRIEDVMTPPWFVPDTRPVDDQLKAFLRRKQHFALVVDEYGEVQGMITLEDIIEEIIGDIRDEHDAATPGTRKLADGSTIVDGAVPIRDLNRAFNWGLPDEEVTTLAGLVIHEAREIPAVGAVYNFLGYRFEVLKKRKHQLTSIKVTPGPPRSQTAA